MDKRAQMIGALLTVLVYIAGILTEKYVSRDRNEGDADYPKKEYMEDFADSEIAYADKARGIVTNWEVIQADRMRRWEGE